MLTLSTEKYMTNGMMEEGLELCQFPGGHWGSGGQVEFLGAALLHREWAVLNLKGRSRAHEETLQRAEGRGFIATDSMAAFTLNREGCSSGSVGKAPRCSI